MALLSLQGCGAIAWVAAVGTDSMRTSDIRFGSFERSWVFEDRSTLGGEGASLSSLAVMPVDGDTDMGGRLIQVLRDQTALRVESSDEAVGEATKPGASTADRADGARRLARTLSVDAVLFGNVARVTSHPGDWGWKEQQSRRLYLYLLDRDGHLLWRDELPFVVLKGAKPPLEEAVESTLALHLMDHVRDLGLDNLGYLPKKIS